MSWPDFHSSGVCAGVCVSRDGEAPPVSSCCPHFAGLLDSETRWHVLTTTRLSATFNMVEPDPLCGGLVKQIYSFWRPEHVCD